jgi:hypothetical protein
MIVLRESKGTQDVFDFCSTIEAKVLRMYSTFVRSSRLRLRHTSSPSDGYYSAPAQYPTSYSTQYCLSGCGVLRTDGPSGWKQTADVYFLRTGYMWQEVSSGQTWPSP